jgi:hypothetical protein
MAYPPSQSITIQSAGVQLATLGQLFPVVFGTSSLGSNESVKFYSNPNTLKSERGHGGLVEVGLSCIARAGGCIAVKTSGSTAAANSAVTPTRVGTSVGTITVAGSSYYPHRVVVRIRETTSALGDGQFDYSLDGGNQFGAIRTIPAGGTFTIPGTNLTITFILGVGTPDFEEGDEHAFTATPAEYSTTNIGDAVDALLDSIGTRTFMRVMWTGRSASAAGAATMFAALETHMATFDENTYFARSLMDVGADTTANAISAFAEVVDDDRIGAVYGEAECAVRDSFEGWGTGRIPASWVVMERAAGTRLDENLGRKASGSLRGVTAITDEEGTWGHDEGLNTAFTEDHRIITLRSYRGETGFYVTNGFLKSAASSSFKYFDWGLVIDAMSHVVQREQDKELLKNAKVLQDGTGRLSPDYADPVEKKIRAALDNVIMKTPSVEPGQTGVASAIMYNIDRSADFLSSETLVSTFGAVPKTPITGIETTGGLVRTVEGE